jgi:ribonucleoside-diphosphate reductase alpha chain
MRNLYDGVPMEEVLKASILAARTLIEKDPDLHLRHCASALPHHFQVKYWASDVAKDHDAGSVCRLFPRFH